MTVDPASASIVGAPWDPPREHGRVDRRAGIGARHPDAQGFGGAGSRFVNNELDPKPSFPLRAPGLTITVPLVEVNPPLLGTTLDLFRVNSATGTLMPAFGAGGAPIVGRVSADGRSATFTGILSLSTIVALTRTSQCRATSMVTDKWIARPPNRQGRIRQAVDLVRRPPAGGRQSQRRDRHQRPGVRQPVVAARNQLPVSAVWRNGCSRWRRARRSRCAEGEEPPLACSSRRWSGRGEHHENRCSGSWPGWAYCSR